MKLAIVYDQSSVSSRQSNFFMFVVLFFSFSTDNGSMLGLNVKDKVLEFS